MVFAGGGWCLKLAGWRNHIAHRSIPHVHPLLAHARACAHAEVFFERASERLDLPTHRASTESTDTHVIRTGRVCANFTSDRWRWPGVSSGASRDDIVRKAVRAIGSEMGLDYLSGILKSTIDNANDACCLIAVSVRLRVLGYYNNSISKYEPR